jgi:hypothetical protein
LTNRKKELSVAAIFGIGKKLAIFIRGLSIDASYQVSDHLAMRFQRRFLEIDESETRIGCGGHVC